MTIELNERRTTKRIAIEIPLELITLPITIDKGSQSSQTQNISCCGLYCRLEQYIPPFTNVEINLFLPPKEHNIQQPKKFFFKGIVVRTDPAEKIADCKEYHIAIFAPSGINLMDQQIFHFENHQITHLLNQEQSCVK